MSATAMSRSNLLSIFTVTLPSGIEWTPSFVESIDSEKCVGCGRCFKVCLRQVLQLRGVDEDGDLLDADDEDEEYERKVMTVAASQHCIGCQACAQVCAKKCFSHAPLVA